MWLADAAAADASARTATVPGPDDSYWDDLGQVSSWKLS
jgi:hypothetical protein